MAAAILATSDEALAARLESWRREQTDGIAETPE
jgi:5-(carboxyamino)imidazole ribonucleotide mutase